MALRPNALWQSFVTRFRWRRRREPGWLVLSWRSSDTLLLVHTTDTTERPEVTLLAEERVARGDAAALLEVARRYRLSRYQVLLLLSLDEYQMLMVEAPGVPKEELKAAVRWRVRDLLDYHIDDATLDVLEIPQGPESIGRPGQLFVVAAHNRVIQGAIELCQQAKVPLAVIDIPEMASRNIANRLAEAQRAVALLSFTYRGGLLTVSYEGELLFARHIDFTRFHLGEEGRADYYERITLEVQRSFDYIDRQMPFAAISRLWLAPFPEAEALRTDLAQNLFLPVDVIELTQLFDFSLNPTWATPEWFAPLFLPLGASLREEPISL